MGLPRAGVPHGHSAGPAKAAPWPADGGESHPQRNSRWRDYGGGHYRPLAPARARSPCQRRAPESQGSRRFRRRLAAIPTPADGSRPTTETAACRPYAATKSRPLTALQARQRNARASRHRRRQDRCIDAIRHVPCTPARSIAIATMDCRYSQIERLSATSRQNTGFGPQPGSRIKCRHSPFKAFNEPRRAAGRIARCSNEPTGAILYD
jgi:hypothetical protein